MSRDAVSMLNHKYFLIIMDWMLTLTRDGQKGVKLLLNFEYQHINALQIVTF